MTDCAECGTPTDGTYVLCARCSFWAVEAVTNDRCAVCGGRTEYLDPTGDGLAAWWAHEKHPTDHHDAVPSGGETNV